MAEDAKQELIVARMFHNVVIATPARNSLWDRMQIHQVLDKLVNFLDAKKPPALIVDLERVEKLSSEAIGALLKIRDHAVGQDCQLRLCNLQPPVHEVLKITELTQLFDIYDDLPDAYRGLVPDTE
jgi:anti-anti-sigma factor